MRQTLESARVDRARGVAVVTHDDMENIETGIVLLEILGSDTKVPIVMRVQGRALGTAVNQRFGFENVRSIVDLAAPWFIGAAMGLQVLGTFWVGQRSFMVGAMLVAAGSELDGLRMVDLSTQARVIAITRPEGPVSLRPRRDARLKAGDTVVPHRPVPRADRDAAQGPASTADRDRRWAFGGTGGGAFVAQAANAPAEMGAGLRGLAGLDGRDFCGGVGSAYALKVDFAGGEQFLDAALEVAGGEVGVQVRARA